jgi:hypothetical protein
MQARCSAGVLALQRAGIPVLADEGLPKVSAELFRGAKRGHRRVVGL